MSFERLAELLFPDVERDADDYERLYPERKLPEGAKVTRIAPSPTGFIHLGNLYGALTDERLAHQSGGIFFLRIEDTDAKREVANGAEMIRACLRSFGLVLRRGRARGRRPRGVRRLIGSGSARTSTTPSPRSSCWRARRIPASARRRSLPKCALSRSAKRSISAITANGPNTATCRSTRPSRRIRAGEPYVLRFRSEGDPSHYLHLTDQIRGKIDMPEIRSGLRPARSRNGHPHLSLRAWCGSVDHLDARHTRRPRRGSGWPPGPSMFSFSRRSGPG